MFVLLPDWDVVNIVSCDGDIALCGGGSTVDGCIGGTRSTGQVSGGSEAGSLPAAESQSRK